MRLGFGQSPNTTSKKILKYDGGKLWSTFRKRNKIGLFYNCWPPPPPTQKSDRKHIGRILTANALLLLLYHFGTSVGFGNV